MNNEEKFNLIVSEIQIYFKHLNKCYYEEAIDLEQNPKQIIANHKAYLHFINYLRKEYLNMPPIGENIKDIQKKFMFKDGEIKNE